MDRRFVLALVLSALVFFLTPYLFPPQRAPQRAALPASGDTATASPVPRPPSPATAPDSVVAGDGRRATGNVVSDTVAATTAAETTVVSTPRATYKLSSLGAALVGAEMLGYHRLPSRDRTIELGTPGSSLLRFAVVVAGDTIDLARMPFTATQARAANAHNVEYRAPVANGEIIIRYAFGTDTASSYRATVSGVVRGVEGARNLLVYLPPTFQTGEADTIGDQRSFAFAFMSRREGSRNVGFGALDPGERRIVEGPHTWGAAKTKYFVVGALAPPSGEQPFASAIVTGAPRTARTATHAVGTLVQPLREGSFQFELYAGPQEWKRLLRVGQEFDQVNPYGWRFMQGVIQPFATIVMRILLWLRNALDMSYGWVLVIFGVAVRIVLWPLNQRAMRAGLKMQQIQPRILEVQKKFANDKMRQQQEMMRVYKEHGASPFTALSGCLPMLLPMPFLVALFFIFQNTIEFRGVPFMWLDDLSLKDPYYILPLAMGASMYLVSWIGLKNAPPNPQAKMMSYVFPVMMTVFLLNLASGLNLYYAVQNLATIPQQWLIARERAKVSKQ